MKRIKNDVVGFRVKVRENWICEVSELPQPDYAADTIEQSERCESYNGESDEYIVEVHRNTAETTVMVFDKNNREIYDFAIDNIKETI